MFTSLDGTRTGGDPLTKAALWEAGVRSVVEQIAGAGIPIIIINPIPQISNFDLRSCPLFRIVTDQEPCGRTVTRADAEAHRAARGRRRTGRSRRHFHGPIR